MCFMEGLTRKLPAFNFLKFIYAEPFSKINLFKIEEELQKNEIKNPQCKQLKQSNSEKTLKDAE